MPDDVTVSCPICLELAIGSPWVVTPCNHWFHRDCLLLWSRKSQTCPYCREGISLVQSYLPRYYPSQFTLLYEKASEILRGLPPRESGASRSLPCGGNSMRPPPPNFIQDRPRLPLSPPESYSEDPRVVGMRQEVSNWLSEVRRWLVNTEPRPRSEPALGGMTEDEEPQIGNDWSALLSETAYMINYLDSTIQNQGTPLLPALPPQ